MLLSLSKFALTTVTAVLALASLAGTPTTNFLSYYKGTPYQDSLYHGGPQAIPGRVQCAFYDLGGEGIAYHDTTEKNEGSGGLNPADGSYLNEFRMHEAIDNNPYNKVVPEENQLYVGWTQPGEWFHITVNAKHAGSYSADLLYTSNRGGNISIDVNEVDATGPIAIQSTNDAADPIAWRQWHHWNIMKDIAQVKLTAGKNVLTVHILTEGNMNLAYFQFRKV
jgi:hypothetical protein